LAPWLIYFAYEALMGQLRADRPTAIRFAAACSAVDGRLNSTVAVADVGISSASSGTTGCLRRA
jgi:hypothetical protein